MKIGRANAEILEEALALIQTIPGYEGMTIEEDGKVSLDNGYQATKVDIAIKCPQLKGGLGLIFRGRELQVIGQPHRNPHEFDELRSLIIRTYEVIAVEKALKSMGYDVGLPLPVAGTNRMRVKAWPGGSVRRQQTARPGSGRCRRAHRARPAPRQSR